MTGSITLAYSARQLLIFNCARYSTHPQSGVLRPETLSEAAARSVDPIGVGRTR